jgi:hypothetical protein
MSFSTLAWTTVSLLVLLLPGFLFFIGVYVPERLSRDKVQDSALSRLAGVVLISFVTHGIAVFLIGLLNRWLPATPGIHLEYVIAVVLGAFDQYPLAELARAMTGHSGWIVSYVLITAAAGFGMGWVVGAQIVGGKLRRFARHGWIYDLIQARRDGAFVYAYVLTHIKHEERLLMYRGFLKDFHVAPDGRIASLVMIECVRFYLRFDAVAPITSEMDDAPGAGDDIVAQGAEQWLMIDGEDIANVVFETYRPVFTREGEEELKQALASNESSYVE